MLSTIRKIFLFMACTSCLSLMVLVLNIPEVFAQHVRVDIISKGEGPAVSSDFRYSSMVTLYIENKDGTKTPSGWSTREEDGAAQDQPFSFQPGKNLIVGWTEGVLQMKEGERAWLHVPAAKGYGKL